MPLISKWTSYDAVISSEFKRQAVNGSVNYTHIARNILGNDADSLDIESMRKYISNNFKYTKSNVNNPKILFYDLETSLCRAEVLTFWPREMYVSGHDLIDEPRIISVAWSWLHEDKIHDLTWDDGDDYNLTDKFLDVFNSADFYEQLLLEIKK